MRKIPFIAALLMSASVSASVSFSAADLKLQPGETTQLEIYMTNDASLEAFQMDIALPEGFAVQGTTKSEQTQLCGILEEQAYSYSVGITADGRYGIRVYSLDGLSLPPSSGQVLAVNVKADETVPFGQYELALTNIILSQGGVAVDLTDVAVQATVYQAFTLTVTTADPAMGYVGGDQGTFEAGQIVTVTATANEGYHFEGWAEGETIVSTDMSYTFTLNANTQLTAQFAVNFYDIIYIVGGQEWARDHVAYGAPFVLRDYTADDGYDFHGWIHEGQYDTMPAHDVTCVADLTTGLSALAESQQLVDVFTPDGRQVARQVSVGSLTDWPYPAGVYIVGGRKIVIVKR